MSPRYHISCGALPKRVISASSASPRHRQHGFDPAEAAQRAHRLAVVVAGRARGELLLQRMQSLLHALERARIVVEVGLRRGVGNAQS